MALYTDEHHGPGGPTLHQLVDPTARCGIAEPIGAAP